MLNKIGTSSKISVSLISLLSQYPSLNLTRYVGTTPLEDIKSPDFNEEKFKGMKSHFPCLDRLKEKEKTASGGITGMYGEKVH